MYIVDENGVQFSKEWDEMRKKVLVRSWLAQLGAGKGPKNAIDCDRAYRVEKRGPHSAERYPCVVETQS